jgi:hypothetical protein
MTLSRAAEVSRDLGVAAVLEVVGLDRLALLRSEGLEQLKRRSACGRLEDLERFVIELDRMHRERASRGFLARSVQSYGTDTRE